MCFKPVNLGFTDCPIRKLNGGSPFPLTTAAFTMRAVQITPDVHASARSDCFDITDLAEELDFHRDL